MLNIAQDMAEGQGLNKDTWYAATVVDNKDPKKLGRVKCRIKEIFDGIKDEDLPWAIPQAFAHTDGGTDKSGVLVVPKKKSKVLVHFQKGNPLYPEYKGYNVDEKTTLQEAEMNYPDRAVIRFQNKTLLVIDTKENIIYARSPGDCRLSVVGNLQLEVFGNVTEHIHGNVTRQIDGDLDETIKGKYTRTVKGNLTEHVLGTQHVTNAGDFKRSVAGSMNQFSAGDATLKSASTLAVEGEIIHENSGVGAPDPGFGGDAKAIKLDPWPGIRGEAKGNCD